MDQSGIQSIIGFSKLVDLSSWITAGATLILATLTFIYVRLTGKILSAHSDPCVILTVVHDEERTTLLQLVVRNIGSGLAHEIKFEFSRPLPARAFGLTKDNVKKAAEMKEGPLINGIPALGPGDCRKIDWGQYGGLSAALGGKPIIATCRFKKNGKEMEPTHCPLEVESFAGTVAAEKPAAKIAKELEKISESIQHLSSGFHKLKVEVVSLPPEKNIDDDA